MRVCFAALNSGLSGDGVMLADLRRGSVGSEEQLWIQTMRKDDGSDKLTSSDANMTPVSAVAV